MKIELQRLVDGIWYIYGNYDMSKTHDATAFGEAVSELAKHFNIRTVVSYTDVEKQVEGLEDKVADIKANCDLAIEGRDIKIKELEQKNNKLLDVINNQDIKIADLEKQIEQIEKVSDYNADQLTKAKEIIRTFLNMPMPNNEEVFADVGKFLTKAEQFLKEIEK